MPENRAHAARGGRIAVDSERDRNAVKCLLIVACVAILWMTAVFLRLGYLQLVCHSEYMARARRQQQRVIEITPKRGAIYDRNMHPLAMSIPVDSAFAVPAELGDEQLAARLLSGVLGIPREVLETRLESSHSFVWIARKLPPGGNLRAIHTNECEDSRRVSSTSRGIPRTPESSRAASCSSPSSAGTAKAESTGMLIASGCMLRS